ncbi:MAG: chorismate lyase [Pseudomonadota bacterium]
MSKKLGLIKSGSGKISWLNKPILSGQLKPWLIDSGSLTSSLQQHYSDFKVQPVVMKFGKVIVDETHLLQISTHTTALIREVLLIGEGRSLVFAHSVLPRSSLRGAWHAFGKLGNKPLGAALFANQKVKRAPLSYKKLSPHQVLYQKAAQHLVDKPAYLWARRSVFRLNCATILVTEVFLPSLLK